jgi:hypothetical protein
MENVLSLQLRRKSAGPYMLEIMTLTNQVVEPVVVSKLNTETGNMDSGSLVDLYPPLGESCG